MRILNGVAPCTYKLVLKSEDTIILLDACEFVQRTIFGSMNSRTYEGLIYNLRKLLHESDIDLYVTNNGLFVLYHAIDIYVEAFNLKIISIYVAKR